MRFGGFVATYKRPEKLRETLDLLTHQTIPPETILVVDNARCKETEAIANEFRSRGVVYEAMSDNLGSAGGTAYGAQWLFDRGFDLIYFGDDDDPPRTADTIERLMKILKDSGPNVAGVGAVGARWDWKKGELQRFSDKDLTGVIEVDVIGGNHHLIVRKEGVEKFGVPNSRLFFGYPDVEYCLRIRRAGYSLLVDGELMRIYRQKTNRLNLHRRKSFVPPRQYRSIWRNYYTTRNYINMMKRTFNRPDLAVRESLKVIVRVPLSWARGPKYGAAFSRLQLRAVWDGYLGRMGRTIMPGDK